MYWRRLLTALAFGAVALSAVTGPVTAAPITDESATSIKISPTTITPLGDQTFSVTVERVDDLLDDDGGLIAERLVDVQLTFEVADDAVLVNGMPVEFGVSTISVDSTVQLGSVGRQAGLTAAEVEPAFDIGLARIRVKAQSEKVLIEASELADLRDNLQQDGKSSTAISEEIEAIMTIGGTFEVRRVIVAARILEINGYNVVQSNVVEQIFDITPSGSVHRGRPKALPKTAGTFDADELAQQAHSSPCHGGMHHPLGQQMAHVWHRLPMAARVSIAIFGATLLLLTLFVALPFAMYAHRRMRRDPAYQALGDDESHINFDIDEKKTGGLVDPQMIQSTTLEPPAYSEEDETAQLVPRSAAAEAAEQESHTV